ncbi:MAG: galactose oxidase [Gammaproteobacteria bacterium CG22_combo_CG10-13_8_21_14_all_40_8]|nr:MAG: galactose oxidase [Gammaproteobacteria bacterium CG22_combo_CG10-13_8_21_14_all_40_8]
MMKQWMGKSTIALLFIFFTLAYSKTVDLTSSDPLPNQLPNLPQAVSNNAAAQVSIAGKTYIASFNGLGKEKDLASLTSSAYLFESDQKQWKALPNVPGNQGVLASSAVGLNGALWVIGGYTVAKDHSEFSTPHIYRITPPWDHYQLETQMPTPVDDTVALTWKQRFLVLVSGWSNDGNVDLIQLYDAKQKVWQPSIKFPGQTVFGHSGAILNDKILILDGVGVVGRINGKRQFAAISQAWLGTIQSSPTIHIDWKRISDHPGKPRYRMGAISLAQNGWMIFLGGSENPYNYNGIGYDSVPSEPASSLLIFDVNQQCWLKNKIQGPEVMDLRGLILWKQQISALGGMGKNQQVLDKISEIKLQDMQVEGCIPVQS